MTVKLFYQNPYQAEFEAKVVEVSGNNVVLDQTCFFPQGGGQVGDTGELNGVRVTDTIKSEDKKKIFHVLEKPALKVGDAVKGKIDWERRYKTMKLHSISHIVMYFMKEVFGDWCNALPAALVDDKKDRSTYTFKEPLNLEKLKLVEKKTNDFIAKGIDIKTWADAKNPDYRYWKCDMIELPCGGTSVKNTKEVGKIILEKGKSAGTGKQKIETMLADNAKVEVVQKTEPSKKENKQIKKDAEGEKSLFWADQIAHQIITRTKFHFTDMKIKPPVEYVVKTSASLSGVLHIGRLSDTIRGESVYRALKDAGVKARIIWVAEDMDPLRKVPEGVPKNYVDYIGTPVTDIPDPHGCHKSYADHHVAEYFEVIDQFVNEKLEKFSMRAEYKKGNFKQYIKQILEHAKEVVEIQNKFREKPLGDGWSPWTPICENCGKIITPKITAFKDGKIYYKCQDYSFEKYTAKGCGYEGVNDPMKGNGKLMWKSEWATQWVRWGVCSEGAGKEYESKNSAFWINAEIVEKVMKYPMPVPIFYEHLMIDGVKMSASLGNVIYPRDWLLAGTPQLLRFLYNKKLMKTRSFSWKELPVLYDDYDEHAQIYFGLKKAGNEKEEAHAKRLYEMSQLKGIQKPVPVRFSYAAELVQVFRTDEDIIESLKSTGHYDKEVHKEIVQRLNLARNWIAKYAPEEVKIKVAEKVPEDVKKMLSSQQVSGLKTLASVLEKKLNEAELSEEFRKIIAETKLSPQDFYKACYLAIIGKERGPKLAGFIIAVGKERVIKVLNTL